MTRPHIIRADTIDLQDHISPSAKDHTKQPTHPAALGTGPPAPHQAETLREVAAEAEEQQHRSPRLSNDWNDSDERLSSGGNSLTNAHLQQQDALAIAQNGGLSGTEDADMADAEGDDGLEDDMMDKISSSPSIDDGGYFVPHAWPERFDSLSLLTTPSSSPYNSDGSNGRSSSPFVETPDHFPLNSPGVRFERGLLESEVHYLLPLDQYVSRNSVGEAGSAYDDEGRDILSPLPSDISYNFVESAADGPEVCSTDDLFVVQPDLALYSSFEDDFDLDVMVIPYESSEDEDSDEIPFPEDSRFIDSGWGGECLQESEDIDFDLVYALHTFVATVEGQANATKGDTMVLLDDSNSYWWLVRVVKDSSIGYLPAEHIETPTERLARLNKHRNIDLSATMLGDKDQSEKSKNPLKKAIRRRNAKTVTFSAPTYVEASDIDYSSDEEDGEHEYYGQEKPQASQQTERGDDSNITLEAATLRVETEVEKDTTEKSSWVNEDQVAKASSEISRNSDELIDGKSEGSNKSRNGTVRNTDSFFKDDSVETRKITLTPNLLRDDSSASTRASNDSKETRQRATPDKLEKDLVPDKGKDDKKRKEKKEKDKDKEKRPGMLSNLFKRNKKGKIQDEDADDLIYGKKVSGENTRSSPVPSKDSEEFPPDELASQLQSSPQRQPSKLQKQPRNEGMNSRQTTVTSDSRFTENQQPMAPPERSAPVPTQSSIEQPSMRLVQPYHQQPLSSTVQISSENVRGLKEETNNQDKEISDIGSSKVPRSRSDSNTEPRLEKVKKAKVREELDEFDSPVEISPIDGMAKESIVQTFQRPSIPGAYPDSYNAVPADEKPNAADERLSESPVQVSPVDGPHSNPPALVGDTSSQDEEASSRISSPSPELIDADDLRGKKSSENSITTPTSASTWSDAHLRTFFDDDADIRDLLMVVYDKSGVVPAGPDHPITGNLFKEENAKLAEITTRLDGMLGDWLARKAKSSGVR